MVRVFVVGMIGYVDVHIVSSQYNMMYRFEFINSSFSTNRNKSHDDNIRFSMYSDKKKEKRTSRTNQLLSFRVRFITIYEYIHTLFGTLAESRFTDAPRMYVCITHMSLSSRLNVYMLNMR